MFNYMLLENSPFLDFVPIDTFNRDDENHNFTKFDRNRLGAFYFHFVRGPFCCFTRVQNFSSINPLIANP